MTMASSSSTSPKSTLEKLLPHLKSKPFRVMVLGQRGVGKSALVVRFLTQKFIGEYDPTLEKVYSKYFTIDNETLLMEILDSAGPSSEAEYVNLENNIRWAEAFILMYSVTDKCSFDECHRLKFLINHNKRRSQLKHTIRNTASETPVILVGNKTDLARDRMVSTEDGRRRSKQIGCVCFHEISVRENLDQVFNVFRDMRRFYRVGSKWLQRESVRRPSAVSRPLGRASSTSPPEYSSAAIATATSHYCHQLAELNINEEDELIGRSDSASSSGVSEEGEEFRARASTDSWLPPRPSRTRHPPISSTSSPAHRHWTQQNIEEEVEADSSLGVSDEEDFRPRASTDSVLSLRHNRSKYALTRNIPSVIRRMRDFMRGHRNTH